MCPSGLDADQRACLGGRRCAVRGPRLPDRERLAGLLDLRVRLAGGGMSDVDAFEVIDVEGLEEREVELPADLLGGSLVEQVGALGEQDGLPETVSTDVELLAGAYEAALDAGAFQHEVVETLSDLGRGQ